MQVIEKNKNFLLVSDKIKKITRKEAMKLVEYNYNDSRKLLELLETGGLEQIPLKCGYLCVSTSKKRRHYDH